MLGWRVELGELGRSKMPQFSGASRKKLDGCHKRLQKVAKEAIKFYDFTVLEGYRGRDKQNRMVEEGKSQLKYPESKHNKKPAMAVDLAPYPIDWEDPTRFAYLAGIIMGIAHEKGYNIRWGGDWDQDNTIISDQDFNDLPHFEIVE